MLAVVLLIFLVYMFIWVPLFTGSLFIIFLFAPGLILLGPLSSKCLGFMGDSIQYCPIDQSLYFVMLYTTCLVFYFLIGALAGWIYGKFKKKRVTAGLG